MKKNTNERNDEKKLPKFEANTLGAEELCQVTGGNGLVAATGSTKTICHVDGVIDGDGGIT